jgi:hypothetical protein
LNPEAEEDVALIRRVPPGVCGGRDAKWGLLRGEGILPNGLMCRYQGIRRSL